MTIRPFREADLDAVIALFRETVRRVCARDYTEPQLRAWAPDVIDPAAWYDGMARLYVVVAEDGQGVVRGFGEIGADGYIHRFYVHHETQGHGVGTRLLAALEQEALRQGCNRMETEASLTARPFFARRGFAVIAPQEVSHNGEMFANFLMEKYL